MAAAAAVVLLLSLSFHSWTCYAQDGHAMLSKVVDAIEKLIIFYKSNFQNMNLDGIYGLKVVEGQIQRILDEHGQGKHPGLDPRIAERLNAVLQDSIWIGEKAIATVHADDETYFQNLAFIISQPWKHFKPHRRIKSTLRWEIPVYQSNVDSKLDESESDKCMMEINQGKKTKTSDGSQAHCGLTDDCGLVMTKRGLTDYAIVHQLLWTALAEKAGCGTELDSLLKRLGFQSTDHMQEEFCTNNYYEMLAVVHVFMMGRVKGTYQDMFMEQQFVCPSLGFFEFLKKSYLDQILSWQLPSGCFGVASEGDSASEDQHPIKVAPKMDLGKLNVADRLPAMPEDSGGAKRQQVRSQYEGLKPHSQLLQAMAERDIEGAKRQQVRNHFEDLKPNSQMLQAILHEQDEKDDGGKKIHNFLKPNNNMNAVPAMEGYLHPQLPVNKGRKGNNVLDRLPVKSPNRDQLEKLSGMYVNNVNSHKGALNDINRLHGIAPNRLQDNVPRGLHADETKLQGIRPNAGQDLPGQGRREKRDAAWVLSRSSRNETAFILPRKGHDPRPVAPPRRFDNAAQHVHKLGAGRATQRKLLVEKEMPGGCLAHKTGVACGALVMYLRYLIDPGPLDLFAPHEFFPEGSRDLLGDKQSYEKVMSFLSNQMQNNFEDEDRNAHFENVVDFNQREGEGIDDNDIDEDDNDIDEDEEEDEDDIDDDEEEEEEEDEEYDDRDEMYPEAGDATGQQQERKVVRFGANDNMHHDHPDDDYDDNGEEDNDEYTDENEEEEEEEDEGADYIKRVKGDNERAAGKKNNAIDDTEYTYYDDEDEDDDTEPGIIKKHKPQALPNNEARVRTHTRHKPHLPMIDRVPRGQLDSPPTQSVVLLLSATSLLLLIFLYRFMRKRRVHIRFCNRSFFKL